MSARKPLAGIRVLVTRGAGQAAALSTLLRDRGATVIEIPVIEVRPVRPPLKLDVALAVLPSYDWLILTSVNGVEAFFDRMRQRRGGPATPRPPKIAAIGPATQRAIRQRGARGGFIARGDVGGGGG